MEILEIKNKYADERRTEIVNVSGEMSDEDLIPNEQRVITLTKMGYIKNQNIDSYKSQSRGGRGISGMSTIDDDIANNLTDDPATQPIAKTIKANEEFL